MSTNLQAWKPFLGPINRPGAPVNEPDWDDMERRVAEMEVKVREIAQARFDAAYPPGHGEREARNPFAALRVDGVPPPSPTSNPSPKGPTSDHSGAATKPKDE